MRIIKKYSILILIINMCFISCDSDDLCVQGTGEIITKEINVQEFNGVRLKISDNVIITQGSVQEVTITGQENIIDHLKTNVNVGIWDINFQNGCFSGYELQINITLPNIDRIYVSGSGNIIVNDFENQNDMTLKISGSGNINLNKITGTQNLIAKISGSGDINLQDSFSTLESLEINMSGSGSFNGFIAPTKICDISNSGSGSNKIHVLESLDVSISGSGNTYYKGMPQIIESISGSGAIINAN